MTEDKEPDGSKIRQVDDPASQGQGDSLGPVFGLKFAENVFHMGFHRLLGDPEAGRYLFVRLAFGNARQDLTLAPGECFGKPVGLELPGDFLVVVPGCQMDFELVDGISRKNLGEGNVHSIYDYRSAALCRDAIKRLGGGNDGKLVFTNTYTKVKCGGAPKKICLLAEDSLRKRNLRDNFKISYFANQNELMKPKVYGDRLVEIFADASPMRSWWWILSYYISCRR